MKKSIANVFVHSTIESQIKDQLKVVGTLQTILYQTDSEANNDDFLNDFLCGWNYDIEPMSINKIEFMGKVFEGSSINEAIYFIKDKLEINVWDYLIEDLEDIIRCSGSLPEFVYEETGISLPKLNVLANEI